MAPSASDKDHVLNNVDRAAVSVRSRSTIRVNHGHRPGWKVNWVPFYLWMSGFNGNFGVRGHVTLVDASFSDVFDKLNIGYMTVSVC